VLARGILLNFRPAVNETGHVGKVATRGGAAGTGYRPGIAWLAFGFAVLVFAAQQGRAAAPEYLAAEQPAAASVEDEAVPMEEAYVEEILPPTEYPELKKRLEDAAPFWRDSRFLVRPRSYYFDRERENTPDSVAAAYGGWLEFRSGAVSERLRANGTLFTTQRAYGPNDKDGTLLLGEGQEGFWVLGEANAEIGIADGLDAKLYRQSLNLPYVNRSDSRMVPNTFEAYTLTHDPAGRWAYLVSHVRQMKLRNSDDFVSMSEAAGFSDRDEPLTLGGARFDVTDHIGVGATYQYAWEFMETFYAEANAVRAAGEDLAFRLGVQYTGQESVGDEIGGRFDTSVYGGKLAASYRNATLTLAFTSTDDARIRSPFGGYPGYLSLMIQSFNRAEEDGWLAGFSYDFSRIGLPGLSGFVNYAEGDTPDNGPLASPDQWELDITVDYRFQSRPLTGLWIRARAATLDQDDDAPGANDVDDLRLIVNYEVPIL
jgi:hypothetical protein